MPPIKACDEASEVGIGLLSFEFSEKEKVEVKQRNN